MKQRGNMWNKNKEWKILIFRNEKKKEKVLISFFYREKNNRTFLRPIFTYSFHAIGLKKFKLYLYRKLINEITSKNKKKNKVNINRINCYANIIEFVKK